MAFVQTWVEQKLLEQGVTAAQLSEVAGRTAATNQISIANSIGSLRFIGNMDWRNYVESLSEYPVVWSIITFAIRRPRLSCLNTG